MARLLAWALAAVAVAAAVALTALNLANGQRIPPPGVGAVIGVTYVVVGALVASRRPRNPIGWIYLVGMVFVTIGGYSDLADQYAYYATVTRPGSLPAPEWAMWLGELLLSIGFSVLVTFPLLLFPNGHLPSPRWRPVAIVAAIAIAAIAALAELHPGPLHPPIDIESPTAMPGLPGLDLVSGFLGIVEAIVVLLAVLSVFLRFRSSTGVERQQIKWFALGAMWVPATGILGVTLSALAPAQFDAIAADLWPLSILGIPIATAIAILRYRLYDIDVVINRTLVYGSLSASLVATYAVAVLVLQLLLRPFTSGSELAVAASTLTVAALFQPLRSRIQRAVDRRFYRAKYDAERTLEAFRARLRDEVALDALERELVDVVADTVHPVGTTLWVRPR